MVAVHSSPADKRIAYHLSEKMVDMHCVRHRYNYPQDERFLRAGSLRLVHSSVRQPFSRISGTTASYDTPLVRFSKLDLLDSQDGANTERYMHLRKTLTRVTFPL